ncbi:MAG: NAD(P)H-hydrate dehydratase [Methylococcaceae bacterium]|nr:NAD(P)H-hydrate dehydratase [Methylococcaceae bacterium]
MKNLPITLYRAEQVRELDRLAIAMTGISGFELMTKAGHEVFRRICRNWPKAQSLAIFCGAGNNAGDGYIIAELAFRAGFSVNVFSLVSPDRLKGDAFTAYSHYLETHGNVVSFQTDLSFSADVIVDALLGTGLDRPVSGNYAEAIETINRHTAPVIAVDIPSGLNADTGHVMGCAVKADCTVSFIALKQGLLTGSAPEYCGELIYASLDVTDAVFDRVPSSASRVVKSVWPRRNRCSHKGNYGHVLIIGGEQGYSGAIKLAGEAALRIGAGLVSVATRKEHAGYLNVDRPELMCHGVENVGQLRALLEKASVVVVGPGLGQSVWAQELFSASVSFQKPLVIDADGLNLLAQVPQKHTNWILTPHPGEAARLNNCTTADIQLDRFAAASAIQAKYGGIAVLKGVGTLIISDDEIAVSSTGNPGMASGGMGDVLAGVIAGLLAQGFSLQLAAQQGVYAHGLAADQAAQFAGERGLLASDLMPYIRQWANA